jgi:hypothetical protein
VHDRYWLAARPSLEITEGHITAAEARLVPDPDQSNNVRLWPSADIEMASRDVRFQESSCRAGPMVTEAVHDPGCVKTHRLL